MTAPERHTPAHLGEYPARMLEVMEGEAANGKIEGTISKGRLFGVGGSEADIGQPSILTSALGNLERCHGQVDPDHFAASRRQRHRDVTRSGRDFRLRAHRLPEQIAATSRARRSSSVIMAALA